MKAMLPPAHPRSRFVGFTLIEVVLAVGIFVFAIVAILGLFGSALQSSKQVGDEDEALGLARALPSFLQTQGFPTVYNWFAASSGTSHLLYGYYVSPPGITPGFSKGQTAQSAIFYSNTDAALTSGSNSFTHRQGRLFAIQLSISPDMPIHMSATSTAIAPTQTNLAMWSATGSSTLPIYPEAVIPLRANFYTASIVPTGGASSPALLTTPVFTYDTTVSQ